MNVAVVGAGIMGASTAATLATRGHNVVLYEQFKVGHKLGSSHGNSRIIRKAYPDAFYTGIMAEGYPMWHELQAKSDKPIVHECGLLYFGKADSTNVLEVQKSLQTLSVPHQVYGPNEVSRVSPQLRLAADEIAIFTAEAGWVHAQNAIEAQLEIVKEHHNLIIEDERCDLELLDRSYDGFVLCPGPWIRDYVDVPVQVTLQTFAYAEGPQGGPLEGPVWIDDQPVPFYGFPSEPGETPFKLGIHSDGLPLDPHSEGRDPVPQHMLALEQEARRRFGSSGKLVLSQGCLYTNTHNEDFLFGRIGHHGFFASACSGHGFKFGPWIGKTLADFVEGADEPERHPRFFWKA